MITKNDILKMVHHVVKRGKGIPDRRSMHPVRDWFIGLAFATIVFIGGSAYAGSIFFEALNGDRIVTSEGSSIVEYENDAVRDVLTYYETRTERFEAMRASKPTRQTTVTIIEDDDSEVEAIAQEGTVEVE